MNLGIIYDGGDPFDGDLALDRGQLVLQTGQEEIRQLAIQTLQTFFGEWFLDTTIGIPYFDEIYEKQQDLNNIDAIFIDAILAIPGIIQILEFDLSIPDKATRQLVLTFSAQTSESLEPLIIEVALF